MFEGSQGNFQRFLVAFLFFFIKLDSTWLDYSLVGCGRQSGTNCEAER
jgi:hypothetical protein